MGSGECPDCRKGRCFHLGSESLAIPTKAERLAECPIGAHELVAKAMRNLGQSCKHKQPRWAAATRVFAIGSTYAHALCRQYSFDPNEEIGPDEEVRDDLD